MINNMTIKEIKINARSERKICPSCILRKSVLMTSWKLNVSAYEFFIVLLLIDNFTFKSIVT